MLNTAKLVFQMYILNVRNNAAWKAQCYDSSNLVHIMRLMCLVSLLVGTLVIPWLLRKPVGRLLHAERSEQPQFHSRWES